MREGIEMLEYEQTQMKEEIEKNPEQRGCFVWEWEQIWENVVNFKIWKNVNKR